MPKLLFKKCLNNDCEKCLNNYCEKIFLNNLNYFSQS